LLGVHRWSDADLLRVNAYVLKVDEAIAFLDFVWEEAAIANQLVNQCVIREELAREPIVLTDAEVQDAFDQFRAAKKLLKSEDTLRWLEHNGMTHESLERFVTDNRLIDKLRDRVAAHRVDEYFRLHNRDFDTVRIARIEVADEGNARKLADQIGDGALDFFSVAERCFLEAANCGAVLPSDLFAIIERRQTTPAIGELIFAAAPGQLIGPVPSEHGYTLFRVFSINPARLDEGVRSAIKNILFEEWLAERRQAAQIEWCWGNASKTG
jgi:putative peptide maturation system protein